MVSRGEIEPSTCPSMTMLHGRLRGERPKAPLALESLTVAVSPVWSTSVMPFEQRRRCDLPRCERARSNLARQSSAFGTRKYRAGASGPCGTFYTSDVKVD